MSAATLDSTLSHDPLYEAPAHPLDGKEPESKTQARKLEVWTNEIEVCTAARRCGWRVRKRTVASTGSVYVLLRFDKRTACRVRFADHAPYGPIQSDTTGLGLVLVTNESPGSLSHAVAWLERTAAERVAEKAIAAGEAVAA